MYTIVDACSLGVVVFLEASLFMKVAIVFYFVPLSLPTRPVKLDYPHLKTHQNDKLKFLITTISYLS